MLRRKLLVASLVLVLVAAFTLLALAQETMKAKVEALDRESKKITIGGTEYTLSDEAAQVSVDVGDEVEATIEAGVVKDLKK
jgi:outer membrane receptor protein involved in Fe transport